MNLAIREGLDSSLCCVVFDVPSRTMRYLDANTYLQDHKQNQYIKGYKVFLEHRGTKWTEFFLQRQCQSYIDFFKHIEYSRELTSNRTNTYSEAKKIIIKWYLQNGIKVCVEPKESPYIYSRSFSLRSYICIMCYRKKIWSFKQFRKVSSH